ncbi:PorV/PorQ family protein [Lacibacter luteus]|uniref:PorV/PorQ family protein n=1 Tax=Lacibacter luteus TaxID=2508719 RepID=A0A4Q1CN23_9BACT|nr:PorV/PorQ family protein [Lacibacter luteus]RXK62456.1 PorV/PorQ family protein [Lacibacter luteus]
MITRATLILSVSLLCCVNSFAQIRIYSNEFLNIGAGSRAFGMGGAQVASVNDATAGYWNPAGLTGVKNDPSLSLMHAEYFAGIGKYDFGALAIPVANNKRTVGLSFLRFAVDDIPNTLYLIEPDGSVNYANIRSFSSADYAVILSVAQKLKETENKQMSIGVNAKVIHRNVGTFAKAWGFGLDVGFQMKGKNWSFGAAARDITTTFNAWSFSFTEREKEVLFLTNNEIPVKSTELTAPRLVVGGAYDFKFRKNVTLKAEANLDLTFDGQRNTVISSDVINADPRIGVELNLKDVFFLRGGVFNFQKTYADGDTLNQKKVWIYQPGAGAGFKLGSAFYVDYAFTNLANQSNPLYTHIVSLRLDLLKSKNPKKNSK